MIFRSGVHLHYVWLMTGGEITGGSSFRRWWWKRGGLPSGWCFIKGIHCTHITHHHCKLTHHTLHSSKHFTQIKTSAYIHTLYKTKPYTLYTNQCFAHLGFTLLGIYRSMNPITNHKTIQHPTNWCHRHHYHDQHRSTEIKPWRKKNQAKVVIMTNSPTEIKP